MPKPKPVPLPFSRAAFRAAYVETLTAALASGEIPMLLGTQATPAERVAKMLGDYDPGRPFPLYLRQNTCAMRAAKRFGFTTDRDFRAAWAAATPEDLPPVPAPMPIEVPCPTCAEPMTPGGWHED